VSGSSAANLFVDEALRMEEHPGVVFRQGPADRRAVVMGGPDVWEIVRSVQDARRAEPDLPSDDVLHIVSANTGVPRRQLDIALQYWSAYPDDVDVFIGGARDAEHRTQLDWERREGLLAP